MGDDTREGGTGPGGEHARHDGDGKGSEERGGSMDGSAQGSRDGQKGGAPEGMYGGKGELDTDGVPAGSGLIGGLIRIPATLKGAVELALIPRRRQRHRCGIGPVQARSRQDRDRGRGAQDDRLAGRVTAVKETKTAIKQLATSPKTAAAWRAASKAEKAAVTRSMYWELQRRYCDDYLEAARQALPWFERLVAAKEKGDMHGRVDAASFGKSLHLVGDCYATWASSRRRRGGTSARGPQRKATRERDVDPDEAKILSARSGVRGMLAM